MHILKTKNFILRHVNKNDVNDYLMFWNDAEVMKYIGDGTLSGGIEVVTPLLEKNIKIYAEHTGFGFWGVQDKQTGRVIGEAGLVPIVGAQNIREVEAGYMLHRDYWGKGYGTELLTGLIDYGFNNLKLDKIIAVAHPSNHASIKIMEKCGMKFEGTGMYHNRYSVKYFMERN